MADEQLIEQVADQIEEVAEVTRRLTGREVSFFVVGAGIGVAVGFGAGYFVMGKRLETKFRGIAEEMIDKEVSELREHYRKKVVSLDQQAQSRRPLEEIIVERGYSEVEIAAIDETIKMEEAEAETRNVFAENSEWNYEVEMASREEGVPYIIHFDEHEQNEPDHEQVTFTYYEVDDVVADVRDQPIDDMDAVVGLGNLGRWGHGSNDPNIVYIRNEELSIDIELVRDRGSFADATNSSMRHSSTSRRRRPLRRFDDDN